MANDPGVINFAALAGLGVALLPVILIRPEVESGQLLPVLPDWEGPPTEIGAVYPSRRGLSPKVRVFRAANKTPWRCCVTLPYCLYCLRSHA